MWDRMPQACIIFAKIVDTDSRLLMLLRFILRHSFLVNPPFTKWIWAKTDKQKHNEVLVPS